MTQLAKLWYKAYDNHGSITTVIPAVKHSAPSGESSSLGVNKTDLKAQTN